MLRSSKEQNVDSTTTAVYHLGTVCEQLNVNTLWDLNVFSFV